MTPTGAGAWKVIAAASAAWLRLGESEAATTESAPFDRAALDRALTAVRGLMTDPPQIFEPAMKRLCADAGVVVAIVAEVKGSRVNGATRWLSPTRALIQLSVRYRREDISWFTFFHKAGHVLPHGNVAPSLTTVERSRSRRTRPMGLRKRV